MLYNNFKICVSNALDTQKMPPIHTYKLLLMVLLYHTLLTDLLTDFRTWEIQYYTKELRKNKRISEYRIWGRERSGGWGMGWGWVVFRLR